MVEGDERRSKCGDTFFAYSGYPLGESFSLFQTFSQLGALKGELRHGKG